MSRDDLIGIVLEEATDNGVLIPTLTSEDIADAILAAGYRKPRTITTEEELIALPIGAVVLSESYTHYLDRMRITFQKWNDETWHRYGRASDTHPDNFLPATVLYEPS